MSVFSMKRDTISSLLLSSAVILYHTNPVLAQLYSNSTNTTTVTPPSGISYPNPTGVSTQYTTTSYNAALASTYLPQTDFSDEQLAFLWDQVGPIRTGSLTTTVSPTPEPSSFARPGIFHPYVPSYEPALNNVSLPANFIWGVASSAFQIEVRMIRSI